MECFVLYISVCFGPLEQQIEEEVLFLSSVLSACAQGHMGGVICVLCAHSMCLIVLNSMHLIKCNLNNVCLLLFVCKMSVLMHTLLGIQFA